METATRVIGHTARTSQVKHRRYELAGWEFKPDKQGIRQKRAPPVGKCWYSGGGRGGPGYRQPARA